VVTIHQRETAAPLSVKIAMESFTSILGENDLGSLNATLVALATMNSEDLHATNGEHSSSKGNMVAI
jgi:hypothetical protein